MLVSDRANSLIKLGSPAYFDVCSMPDLFHFNQEFAHAIGAPLGKAWKRAKDNLAIQKSAKSAYSEWKEQEDKYLALDNCRRRYQNGIHGIHKAVLPSNEDGTFSLPDAMRKVIRSSLTIIEKQAAYIDKEIKASVVIKVIDQIPAMIQGILSWQKWATEQTNTFAKSSKIEIRQEELQKWLLHYLLPVYIWEITLRRVHAKKKNERLRKYYKEVLQKATDKLIGSKLEQYMTAEQYQECVIWAKKVARTFQRSSSQVEGRNGYLAFVHKANRGLQEQRLKVLTVGHNYDIRGLDNTTPAKRLFDRKFPDLFEFILQDVTDFSEPRASRKKLCG